MTGAAAAAIPDFSQVLQFILTQDPELHQWVKDHEPELSAAYAEGQARIEEDGKSPEDFTLENTYKALSNLRHWLRQRKGFGFARPCCTDAKFTWSFCNPKC